MDLKEIEFQAINEYYSTVKINDSLSNNNLIPHGELQRIGKNTNCNYYICHFEHGNEFVPKKTFYKIIEKFTNELTTEMEGIK